MEGMEKPDCPTARLPDFPPDLESALRLSMTCRIVTVARHVDELTDDAVYRNIVIAIAIATWRNEVRRDGGDPSTVTVGFDFLSIGGTKVALCGSPLIPSRSG
jgi:hypothetical protein